MLNKIITIIYIERKYKLMNQKVLIKNMIKMIESRKINEKYFSENLIVEGIKPIPMNKKEYIDFLEKFVCAIPDISYNTKEIVMKGKNTVETKIKISGTNTNPLELPDIPNHPATGRSFKLPEEVMECDIEANRISRIKVSNERISNLINQLQINLF